MIRRVCLLVGWFVGVHIWRLAAPNSGNVVSIQRRRQVVQWAGGMLGKDSGLQASFLVYTLTKMSVADWQTTVHSSRYCTLCNLCEGGSCCR